MNGNNGMNENKRINKNDRITNENNRIINQMTCKASYLNADETKGPFIIGEEAAEVGEIDTDCFTANQVALKLKHGPIVNRKTLSLTYYIHSVIFY